MKNKVSVLILVLLSISYLAKLAVAEDRPHIIVMVADDLGWQDVSYHGEGKISTPHLDSLASRGVQLDQFYVQPVCSPTRGALMTGRYPMRFGMQCGVVRPWASHGLPLEEQTLAEGLQAAGYATAITGKWHLGHINGDYLPLQRGFDIQYGHYNGALDYFTHIRDGGHDWHRNDKPLYEKGYTTDLIGQEAAGIIQSNNDDNPLFLYVPFNAPHTPLQATEKHLKMNAHIENENRRIFAAMVTNMDEAVGTILKAANQHLPRENTLIFFSSDNGGIVRLGSNGKLRDGKSSLYEGGVRVPAIMAWDGRLNAGSVMKEPLHIVDLYPTLLNLAGVKLDQKLPLDGKDAWRTISQGKKTPHAYILHNVTPFHGAIRIGDWKLIRNGQANANVTSAVGKEKWELFNIKNDPYEKNDLSSKRPKEFQRLKKKLGALTGEAVAPHIPPNALPKDFKVPEVWGHPES
jgi:arylsulfatase A-like enzyme